MEINFKKGDIVYSKEDQYTGCGNLLIHKGAIVKIDSIEYSKLRVYKSKVRESEDKGTYVHSKCMSNALSWLAEAYETGKRNISEI